MPGFIRMKLSCHADPFRYVRFACALTTRAPGTAKVMATATPIRTLRSLLTLSLLSREGRPAPEVRTGGRRGCWPSSERLSTRRDQRTGDGDGRGATGSVRSGAAGAAVGAAGTAVG